jgi:hypothetical protein
MLSRVIRKSLQPAHGIEPIGGGFGKIVTASDAIAISQQIEGMTRRDQ